MTPIDRVYIACHRRDLRLTKICVASIREWYPTLPIYLLKDEFNGPFSTTELERRWNVRVWPLAERIFGWGFIKLEPLFMEERIRFLVLDSDIALVGPVLDVLERENADFIVQYEEQPASDIPRLYFDPAIMSRRDPEYPGIAFTFNSGQLVATGGLLRRADFENLVHWSAPRRVVQPDAFNASDQGVLNYVLLKKAAQGSVRVARVPFMKWGERELAKLHVPTPGDATQPYIVHWAGLKRPRVGQMLRSDILLHFERAYYRDQPFGHVRRLYAAAADYVGWIGEALAYRRRRRAQRRAQRRNARGRQASFSDSEIGHRSDAA